MLMNKDWIKNNAPTLLTIAGGVGTVVTSILGIRAGMKIRDYIEDTEKPKKKEIIKACTPVVVSSALTIGCNVSADILNRQQKSDLLAISAMIGASYSGYRQEVINRYGAEVDREITDTVARNAECMYMAPDIPDKLCHWVINMYDENIPVLYFDAYERDVLHAEMHFNRNYILGGGQSVSALLEFLGFARTPYDGMWENTDIYGWAINDSEIYYVDFEHRKIGEDTFELHPVFAPWRDFWHLDMFGNEY